jgi:hypothetical protein
MKKLLLSTALVGALVTGSALAEVKVGGNVESVYRSGSFDRATDKKGGYAGLGMESNISISGSKDLNNGWKLTAGLELENAGDHQSYTTLSSGNVSFGYGVDFGYNGVSYGIPIVGEGFHDVAGVLGVSANDDLHSTSAGQEVHDAAHFNVTVKAAGGDIGFNFAPSASQGRSQSIADSGGSGYEIGYSGSPVEGLSLLVNRQVTAQNSDSATTNDIVTDNLGITYSSGNFAVGVGQIKNDSGATTNAKRKSTQAGVTYSADAYSVGIAKLTLDADGQTSDEEHLLLTASYNFGGGLGIEVGYNQVDNIGYTSGKDGEGLQIRTLVKF